jgi:3-deoxy-D-arabino-heptulosonate 7-phosphate (DAHP) synthase
MKRATITLPDELAELLGHEARRLQTSVSDVVRQLLVRGLTGSTEKPREIPWAGLFHDPHMVSGERIEEALEPWADDIDRDRG